VTITTPAAPAATAAGGRPAAPALLARTDVRQLLDAVLEALALPYDAHDYDHRIVERASIARRIARATLAESPADLGWNVDYLKQKLAAEQAEADQRAALVCRSCQQPFQPDNTAHDGRARFEGTPWCRWCVTYCRTAGDGHRCRICPTDHDRAAGPCDEDEGVRQSVERAFPVVAAFLAAERGENR
jgi:hypothetical protein